MEILHIIISLLTLIIGAGIIILLDLKKDYKTLNTTFEIKISHMDTYYTLISQNMEKITSDNINILDSYNSMMGQMEKDSYSNLTDISDRVTLVKEQLMVYQEKNIRLFDATDSEFRRISQDIMAIKNNLKRFSDDPDLKARY